MVLKINDKTIEAFEDVAITLLYDSVGSSFSFLLYFDPDTDSHKSIYRPFSYNSVTIEHEGEVLITGLLLSHRFASSASQELLQVSGYSKTGVLEDSSIPKSCYPLQSNGMSIKQIADKLAAPFDIAVKVDDSVAAIVNSPVTVSIAADSQSVKDYLTEVATSRNVIVSHDEMGALLLTSSFPGKAPVFDFTTGRPGISFELTTDGQAMHSEITMQKQATIRGKGNSSQSSISNPYCPVFKPRVDRQQSGRTIDTSRAVRNAIAEEIKGGLSLEITMDRWKLNGRIIRPGDIVTVTNPEIFCYEKTEWFVHQVDLKADLASETAVLHCAPPDAYNNSAPKNIFL